MWLAKVNGHNWYSIVHDRNSEQCDQIWRYFATLAKTLHVFGKILTVYFLFGKMMSLLWQI